MARRLIPLVALVLAACSAQAGNGGAPAALARPVVVELFESQGCSSCPPANANLATVADRPDILALNFSVTYWDQLGWKDTFAKPAFTARQWDYAHAMGQGDVYTPEVVIDGRKSGVGADKADFAGLVRYGETTQTPGPKIEVAAYGVIVHAANAPARPADIWLVRYDPRELQVPVQSGENAGKTLPHRDIVRELTRLGVWNGAPAAFAFAAPADPAWRTAILVQAPKGGPILAAAKG